MMQGILREVQEFVVLPSKSVGNGDSNVQLSDISKDILQLQNVVQSQLEGYTFWSTNVTKRLIALYKSHHTQKGKKLRNKRSYGKS
ncbi:unnamed protein product [Ceutorhynchus assimilis]|uniref:Uncharacterized protein n=1 Tax=Ceutorhynchus assimilis TaxID=467358 RepID=A0A9N9QQJ0_9CUCU|nr:unnamed protein product [Ceutorhynchus assimilis]